MTIEPKELTAEELAGIALDHDFVRPWMWSAAHMDEQHYDSARYAVEAVPRLLAHIAAQAKLVTELETRRDELLRLTVRLTNETPFPDEVKGWTEQRAKLVAEVGTLRSRVAELEQALAQAGTP